MSVYGAPAVTLSPSIPHQTINIHPGLELSAENPQLMYHAPLMDDIHTEMFNSSLLNSSEATTTQATVNLVDVLGPKRWDMFRIVPVTIIYSLIFVSGLIGNVSTCIVIAKNRYMQTATNCYLFNLAIADLLVLILGLPQELYTIWSAYPWIFGETFCIVRVLAAETVTYASILTITAFTAERYVAICHPMRAQTLSGLSRAVKMIIFIWLFSALCSIPIVYQFGIVYVKDANGNDISESAMCSILPTRILWKVFEISTFVFFLAPMTVITVLYVLIGLAIRRSTLTRTGSDISHHSGDNKGNELRALQQAQARRAVLKMLVAVVVAFFICWAPFHTQRLIAMYMPDTDKLIVFMNILYYISGIFYYISTTINPILYSIMSLKFRQAFKSTIFRLCQKTPHKRPQKTFTTYKFYNKPLVQVDTRLTLVNGNNVNAGRRAGAPHLLKAPVMYMSCRGGASHSSSHSGGNGGSVRMVQDEPANEMELEHMLAEHKSLSFHGGGRGSSASNSNTYYSRPYHSFA